MLGTAFVLASFALLGLVLAWSRWLARRRRAAVGHMLLSAVCIAGALLLGPLAVDLESYQRLGENRPAAELYFEGTGAQRFRATLTWLPTGRMQVFDLAGNDWRIDARTLAWKGLAAQLGLKPGFRLERLNARDTSPGVPAAQAVTSHPLGPETAADVWERSRNGSAWRHYVEGRHAYGPWRPMANGARYAVRMRGTALEVDAANEAAANRIRPRS